jgi:hypothetical protein
MGKAKIGGRNFFHSTKPIYLFNLVAPSQGGEDGGDGLVVPSWLALCWIAQGSGSESQRGDLFFGISSRGEISQEGFVQGPVSPPTTSQYIESVRIISEAPLVCPNGC